MPMPQNRGGKVLLTLASIFRDSHIVSMTLLTDNIYDDLDATAKSLKNAAKTNYLPVRQRCQRSKIKGTKYF
jgi:hypothetical protein